MDLSAWVALVTGGTGFLGTSMCRAFLDANATVVAVYGFDRELPYFRENLCIAAKPVHLQKADAAKPGAIDRVAASVLRRFRRIDALVHPVCGCMAGSVEDATAKDSDAAFNLNLKAAFLAANEVIPAMKRRKRGKIVFVSTRLEPRCAGRPRPSCTRRASPG